MPKKEISNLSLTQALVGLDKQEFTSEELVQTCIDRREEIDDKVGAFIGNSDEQALKQAKEVDRQRQSGKKLPALAGLTVSVKDSFNVIGQETRAGSKILEKYISPYDATSVRKLKEAGAIAFGKTNMDEFGMGSSTEQSAYQETHNPWDLERVPGGSSGGSAAAVSTGETMAALGSDTGGSVRQPAALTGVVGLKPTYGRISRYGVVAMASSLDVVGTFTRTVEDAAIMLEAMAGEDQLDATCSTEFAPAYHQLLHEASLKGVKIGLPKEYFGEGIDPEVEQCVRDATKTLEKEGAKVTEISMPHAKYALPAYYLIMPAEASSNLARFDGIRYGESIMRAKDIKDKDLLDVYMETRAKGFGPEPIRRIMLGTYALSQGYYEAFYKRAQKVRTLVRKDFLDAYKKVDVLLTPTSPTVAFKAGEKADPVSMYKLDVLTVAVNVAGVPAMSLPCGFVDGLPAGIQLITADFNEEQLFKVGHMYQTLTDWHTKRPALK